MAWVEVGKWSARWEGTPHRDTSIPRRGKGEALKFDKSPETVVAMCACGWRYLAMRRNRIEPLQLAVREHALQCAQAGSDGLHWSRMNQSWRDRG